MAKAKRTEVHVGPQGRVVLPAHLRRALGIHPGETLLARIEDGRLMLEKPEQVLARLQERFSRVPSEVNLADELISERREEARKEAEA